MNNYFKNININQTFYNNYINYFIILYSFCLPISRAGVSLSIVLIFLFWILEADFKRKFYEIKINYFIMAIFIFIIFRFYTIINCLSELHSIQNESSGKSFIFREQNDT